VSPQSGRSTRCQRILFNLTRLAELAVDSCAGKRRSDEPARQPDVASSMDCCDLPAELEIFPMETYMQYDSFT